MNESNVHLIAFIEALTTGQTDQIEPLVKTAYWAGLSREDLLTAVEIGRLLGEIERPVRAKAYAAIRTWKCMGPRHTPRRQEPVAAPRPDGLAWDPGVSWTSQDGALVMA